MSLPVRHAAVAAGHGHAAQADGRDLQAAAAEGALLHEWVLLLDRWTGTAEDGRADPETDRHASQQPGQRRRLGSDTAAMRRASGGLAAVDDHGVPDGEGRFLGAQPQHGGGDLLRVGPSVRWVPGRGPPGVLRAVSPKTRSIMWVSMMPGQTALMRMPELA